MIQGSCLCSAVQWRLEEMPTNATACNCTACRRYGVLWGYSFEGNGVVVSGETKCYVRGKFLEFHFCSECGCITFWRGKQLDDEDRRRLAVNLRLAEPESVADIPIIRLDGVNTFKKISSDGRCVTDYWF